MPSKTRTSGWMLAWALLLALPSAALQQEVATAEALLEQGEAEKALALFQQLQIDYPQAPEVILGVGSAQYRAGELALASGAAEQARTRFAEAQESFQRLFSEAREEVRSSAMFDYANALARTARTFDPHKEAQRQMRALESAINAYEQVLEAFPDHAGAQQNLDHVRYQLKVLRQGQQDPQEQPPVQIRIEASTDLPRKEAVVEEHEVILQDQGTAPPAPAPSAPSTEAV